MKILIVEDEIEIAQSLYKNLDIEGYEAIISADGNKAIKILANDNFDVILLDWRIPKLSGIGVCRQLRRQGDKTPIILLTALSDVSNKLEAFKAGADDYITKPFSFEEVLARIQAVVRRSQSDSMVLIGGIQLNLINRTLSSKDCKVELTVLEVDLLHYFVKQKNTIIDKAQLANDVWKLNYYPTTNIIEVAIKNLRKKLETLCQTKFIKTIYGEGYIYIEE